MVFSTKLGIGILNKIGGWSSQQNCEMEFSTKLGDGILNKKFEF
jgi:hypothetical protein